MVFQRPTTGSAAEATPAASSTTGASRATKIDLVLRISPPGFMGPSSSGRFDRHSSAEPVACLRPRTDTFIQPCWPEDGKVGWAHATGAAGGGRLSYPGSRPILADGRARFLRDVSRRRTGRGGQEARAGGVAWRRSRFPLTTV